MKKTPPDAHNQQMRCALYARIVAETHCDDSIAEQLTALRQCANKHGWSNAGEYTDCGVSGSNLVRQSLLRLIEDAKAHKFSIVLVNDVNRISRNLMDLHHFAQTMKFHDVRIFSIAEGNFFDTMRVAFHGFQHQVFLNDLASRVRRGQQAAVQTGRGMGRPPYGYLLVRSNEQPNGFWQINPEQAKIVCRIHREFAAGKTAHDIARDLNSENIPYPWSNRHLWSAAHILGSPKATRGIIRNPIYRGLYVWGKTKCRRSADGRRVSTVVPENERTAHECPHLRLVEDSLWIAVQDRLSRRGTKG